MQLNGRKVLVCNCEATMALDGKSLAKACKATDQPAVNSQLCRAQIENFAAALKQGEPLLVACTQEAPLFAEIAAEAAPETPLAFTNIRERAGWSEQGADATPKIAALLAEAALDVVPAPTITMRSEGTCLVYGRDEIAIAAARQLSGRLDVTVLMTRPGEVVPPRVMDVPIFKGTIASVRGHLGTFELVVDDYAPLLASSRSRLGFEPAKNGAASKCDLILDLTGGTSLFPGTKRRDGYFRPDPKNPAAVQQALFELSDLTGEFEKPRYVAYDRSLCAHSRSRKTGCTRCLDVCPASAISPDGDAVVIDPFVCGGCGACHSVCPTGAATYGFPPHDALLERLRTLLSTYYAAGGADAVLLIHDAAQGDELISLMARFGRGLPANVLPFAVNEVTQVGFDTLSVALAYGAAQVQILLPPEKRGELAGLAAQIGMAEALLVGLGYGSGRVGLLGETDPDAGEAVLHALPAAAPAKPKHFLPIGGKKSVTRAALQHLHDAAPEPTDVIQLAAGAPFGAVELNVEGCTLCLACVGACPTGALQDNPDAPQLRFQEDACVQCGLCKNTCPEKVITLEPRFNFAESARQALVLKQEEPFACVRCGKPFGTKSTVERIMQKLASKHSMFMNDRAVEAIQMCNDCRVVAQFEVANPLAGKPRPITRTTEDYLREREEEEAAKNAETKH